MALLITTEGVVKSVSKPRNGEKYGIDELQGFVGGFIELISLEAGHWMVVNEEGKVHGLPYNEVATSLARPFLFDFDAGIAGNALLLEPGQID